MQGIPVLLPISLDKIRILGIPSEEIDGQAYCSLKMLKSSIWQMLESIFLEQLYFNNNKKIHNIFAIILSFFPFLGLCTRKRRIWSSTTRMSGNGSERILAGHPLGRIWWELQLFPVCLLLSANIM